MFKYTLLIEKADDRSFIFDCFALVKLYTNLIHIMLYLNKHFKQMLQFYQDHVTLI